MTNNQSIKKSAGEKPLFIASACRDEEEVDKLLTAGADVNAKSLGETALMRAAGQNHKGIVRKLLKAGARVTDLDWKKRSALSWAVTRGRFARRF